MNGQITTGLAALAAFFVATPLVAEPAAMETRIDASESTAEYACVTASQMDTCAPASEYAFDLSDWINQSVVPDHLNLDYEHPISEDEFAVDTMTEERQRLRMLGMSFQDDDDWVQKLKEIDDLSVMTFWEGEAAHLFLGVNDDGLPGLHFKRRELDDDPHDDQTKDQRARFRQSSDDGRPLVHSQSLTFNTPDLSKTSPKPPSEKPEAKK